MEMPSEHFLEAYDAPHAYNAVGEGAMENGDHRIAQTYFENASTASPSYFEEAEKNLTLAREALAGRGPAADREPGRYTP